MQSCGDVRAVLCSIMNQTEDFMRCCACAWKDRRMDWKVVQDGYPDLSSALNADSNSVVTLHDPARLMVRWKTVQ